MSGGYFDYQQYRISQIADDIKLLIENNNSIELNEWGDRIGRNYPPEIIQHFQDAVVHLKMAFVYVQRIDWLVSGDDGEEGFQNCLQKDLMDLERTSNDQETKHV
jgi:hypothetical protein